MWRWKKGETSSAAADFKIIILFFPFKKKNMQRELKIKVENHKNEM